MRPSTHAVRTRFCSDEACTDQRAPSAQPAVSFKNRISAALTSSGRSCWIQCPAPSMISFSFKLGRTRFISAKRLPRSSPVMTGSFAPAMNRDR